MNRQKSQAAAALIAGLVVSSQVSQAQESVREPASSSSVVLDPFESPAPRSATRESDKDSPVATSPQEEETRLTKNWGGARKRLSDRGIDLALIYKWEFNRVLSGGVSQKSETLGNLDLRASFDFEKLAGWKGTSAFAYVLGDHGGHPSFNAGDTQGTSNIESPVDALKVYELWIQQLFLNEKVSLLLGLHDLNSEFYVTDSAGLFFNNTFGTSKELSQTGRTGPSIFPRTSLAARIRTEPSPSLYFQVGAFNGVAGDPDEARGTHFRLKGEDGVLLIAEAAYLRGREKGDRHLPGKYAVGNWTYSKTFDHQTRIQSLPGGRTAPFQATNQGIYFMADQSYSEWGSVFLRYGFAASAVNRVSSALSTGLVFAGVIPGRPKDRLGFGYARANSGREFRDAQTASGVDTLGAEWTYEANYRLELIPGVVLQPDFQYVIHPSFSSSIPDAKVFATRVELNF